tara:strand:- start:175 stop:348 length:174 start_codon:yes stop_codon:yes gene_type:complete
MKYFKITRQVSMGQTFDIEANTKEEAIKLFNDDIDNAELRDESIDKITHFEMEEKNE